MDYKEDIKRWRLILGKDTQDTFSSMNSEAISSLSEEDWLMDRALDAIYNPTGKFMGEAALGAGRGPSNPQISKWLGDVRDLFDKELVKIIQTDAMDRCGLKQLIFEPEILEQVEPDISLASTIMLLKDQIPKHSKESVRAFIKKIVEEINKLLESDIKRAVRAALNKRQHSPIPSASALDFKRTIQRGIKNYNKELKKIIPEHYYFFERASTNPSSKFTVILDIDQSGSMGESVIYSSVMACILASMAALKTRIVAFDTNCMNYIENPKKTIFFLISDLMEGGNRGGMLRNLQEMKDSGVIVVCLLAISSDGQPYYDSQMAGKISSMGIPCFACNPEKLPLLLERVLKGLDLNSFQEEFKKK